MAKKKQIQHESAPPPAAGMGIIRMALNWAIAGASLAVIAGFGYWAFSLGTRDPNEVPIIRAMEGPARVQAENPGGDQASHQGLAVNSVQSEGGVAAPSDTVTLAPVPEPLSSEDLASANLVTPVAPPKQQAPQETAAEVIAKAIVQDQAAPIAAEPTPRILSGTRFSPSKSLRPASRPEGLILRLTEIRPAVAALPDAAYEFVDSVPLGTRLVQLGAYDSSALAKREWGKLFAKHEDLLEGKKRLVQAAESGGRKFFRLRAVGFNNKDESRTLCSALLARGTPCIPVTAR